MKHPRPAGRGNSSHPNNTGDSYEGSYGGRVRARDPETSWLVAPITPRALSDLQGAIAELLSATPMHDAALVRAYRDRGFPPRSPQRIGTARAELVTRGLVADTGTTALSDYGNASIVWRAVP
ncbi:hypothetical protein [Marisediminicola antarctica]